MDEGEIICPQGNVLERFIREGGYAIRYSLGFCSVGAHCVDVASYCAVAFPDCLAVFVPPDVSEGPFLMNHGPVTGHAMDERYRFLLRFH